MRKRVMFFTSIVVLSSLLLSTQVVAVSEPTRESAQIALYSQPVTLKVDTSSERLLKLPMQSSLTLPATARNIFAPLPKQTAQLPKVQALSIQPAITPSIAKPLVAPTTLQTVAPVAVQTRTQAPQPPLRLSAMIEDVVYQEAERAYTFEEKNYYDDLLATAFSKMPTEYVAQLKRLTLKNSRTGSRGLGGASVMILRTAGVPENDFIGVAIHELGHIIDMGSVTGSASFGESAFMDGVNPVWNNDRSLAFYRISWKNDTERKVDADQLDFVSGYAMSDPFEDFSESFAMYVLHGERFAQLAQKNTALAQKYAYIRDEILLGREFRGIDRIPASQPTDERPYDTTIQPFSKIAFDAIPVW